MFPAGHCCRHRWVHGLTATDDERRFLRQLQKRSVSTAQLRAWLADAPAAGRSHFTESVPIADTSARAA